MRTLLTGLVVAALVFVGQAEAEHSKAMACPFCQAVSLTFSEQIDQRDIVVLAQWAEGTEPKDEEEFAGTTTYEVLEVMKAPEETIAKGDKVSLNPYQAGKPGDLFLLMGNRGTTIDWKPPVEVTETSYNYIKQAPPTEAPRTQRLEYFMQFLEFPDPLVTNDAYSEFANAPYEDIVPLADKMPRERIRKWLDSPNTDVTRLGLYGLMIGLCGTEEDVKFLEKKITEPTEDFRLGIDGIMAGYLVLTGEHGMDVLMKTKLEPRYLVDADGKPILDDQGKKKPFPFSETYAAMQAMRFMWTYGDGKISKDKMREAMRILLERPELADLVIADLARWEDWTVIDRLMTIYSDEDISTPSVKRSVVRYMLVAAEQKTEQEKPTEVAEKAEQYLAVLREKDPDTVEQAERFFLIQ